MSDARKSAPEKWKTVIRHPIRNVSTAGANGLDIEDYLVKVFTNSSPVIPWAM